MRFGKSRKNGKKSKKSRTTVCIIITAAILQSLQSGLSIGSLYREKTTRVLPQNQRDIPKKPTQQGAKSLTATV